jgi:hypothetical protein
MRRAHFYGGGPVDGETFDVYSDESEAVAIETLPARPGDDGARERSHVYRRQPDGRYRYAGALEPREPAPRATG